MTNQRNAWLKEAMRSKYILSYAKDVTKPPQAGNTATACFRSVFGLARFVATDKQVQVAIKAGRVQLITRADNSIARRVISRVASIVVSLRKGTFS